MDADTVLRIKPALTEYLHEFDGCFARSQTRGHFATYVGGQLSDLARKSVEPIADAAGVPPRTLQEFLGLSLWDELQMRELLQQRVAGCQPHPHSVGIIDETSVVKKGKKTACVQRQYCGAVGKTENCVVSVHLGYATPEFHTLLDGELFLPEETWADMERRQEAGIPDHVTYRAKWEIALAQYRRAVGNGLRFGWLTFDELYGRNKVFLRELDGLGQDFVAEVPVDFHVWTTLPEILHREHARDRCGRPRTYPRLKAKHNPMVSVQDVARYSPKMRAEPWVTYQVKEGSKGPMVWDVRHMFVYLQDERGLPTRPYHLLVARSVTDPDTVKYFISNAPESTPVQTLLLVAFSRWRIERMFEDSKMELGLDHFEVRNYGSITRHLILSCVSHLFLAEFHQVERGKKTGADHQPTGDGNGATGTALGSRWPMFAEAREERRCAIDDNTRAKRSCQEEPPQGNNTETTHAGSLSEKRQKVSVAENLAL